VLANVKLKEFRYAAHFCSQASMVSLTTAKASTVSPDTAIASTVSLIIANASIIRASSEDQ